MSALASFVDYERSAIGRAQFRRGTCFVTDDAPGFDAARCLARRPGQRALLVIGDSYAAQYWRAVAERFPDADVMQATAAGCRPLVEARGAARCYRVSAAWSCCGATVVFTGCSGRREGCRR